LLPRGTCRIGILRGLPVTLADSKIRNLGELANVFAEMRAT